MLSMTNDILLYFKFLLLVKNKKLLIILRRFAEVIKSVLNPEEIASKTVPRHIFARLKQELQEKNDTISILQQKVSHLENMIKLKDQRIEDLTVQITRPPIERNMITPRPYLTGSDILKLHASTKLNMQ